MKIYVAGKFQKKDDILEVYEKVKELGHKISYDWTTHKNIKPYLENQEIASEYSNNELNGINECDIFVYLSDEKGTTLPMEFGAALILAQTKSKPKIYALGEFNDKSPWFFNKNVIRKNSIDDFIADISP